MNDTLRPSTAPPRGHGGGSTKNKAARVLSTAPGAILPHKQRSFVDRQYSPSTGIDRSEWEVILEELTWMGYIIKKEPESDSGE
jgi:hypothetical protein